MAQDSMMQANTMHDVEQFVRDFLSDEYKLRVACYKEPDNLKFEQMRSEHNAKFYAEDLETFIRRPEKPDPSWYEDGAKYLSALQERILFQIKKLSDEKSNVIYSVYLSSEHKGDQSYFELYFLKETSQGLRITSIYVTDNEGGFEYLDGEEVGEPLKLIKTVKYQPPSDPADLEEYESK